MTAPFGGPFETILLVENRTALRNLVREILEDADFTVISAASAKEATRLEAEFPGTIDLLLSDIRIGGVSGPNLAKRLQARRPQMRVMLLSGYPGGALLLLNYSWQYVEKPFVASVLVGKITDVLRGDAREQPADRSDALKERRRSFGRATREYQQTVARARRRA